MLLSLSVKVKWDIVTGISLGKWDEPAPVRLLYDSAPSKIVMKSRTQYHRLPGKGRWTDFWSGYWLKVEISLQIYYLNFWLVSRRNADGDQPYLLTT